MSREVNLGDGKILHMPETAQRTFDEEGMYCCDCHKRMGNDFYFLPIASCLRDDRVCNKDKSHD